MANKKNWKFSTKAIHVGNEADKESGSVSPPIHLTSTFKQDAVGKPEALNILVIQIPHVSGWKKILRLWIMQSMPFVTVQEWPPPPPFFNFLMQETISSFQEILMVVHIECQ